MYIQKKMNDEYFEEPSKFGRPKIYKTKKLINSDPPQTINEKQPNMKEIKKIEKEMKEKEKEEIKGENDKEENIEKEELEDEKYKEENLEKEENECICPTIDISHNNNCMIKENLTTIDIKESDKEQNICSKNNSNIDYELINKSINDSISIKIPEIKDDYSNTQYFEKLKEEDWKDIISQIFNDWQLDDIIKVIKDYDFYYNKIFYIISNMGISNCISYPFLNKIVIAIIGISIERLDFGKINYIYNSLKYKIFQHSQDIHSYHVIIALIEAFYTIKEIVMKKFQQNVVNIIIIKNCEEKIDFIYSELKKNDLIKIFMHKNATFVIQYLFNKIDKIRQEEIFECAIKNINILISEKTGYFVLRKIIDIIPKNSKKSDELIKLIIEYENFQELLIDKNGNFLINNILKKTKNKFYYLILSKIKGSICKLAMNQYASYVIEELISVANKKQLKEIIKEINSSKEILFNNNYGNYVMQTLQNKINFMKSFSFNKYNNH